MPLMIGITGLCAFVKKSHSVRVIFPNFRTGVDAHGKFVPPHDAYISFRERNEVVAFPNAANPSRPVNLLVSSDGRRPERAYVLLDGEALTVERERPGANSLQYDNRHIVQMSELVTAHKIDDALLSDDFDPDPKRVLGWLDIFDGSLYVSEAPHILEFRPKGRPTPYRGRFAEIVVWELPSDKYIVKSRHFGAERPEKLWRVDATAANVSFVLGNTELEDLINPNAPHVRIHDSEVVDHHFHRFYELCANKPDTHPLPRRVSALSAQKRSHGGNCPPAEFIV